MGYLNQVRHKYQSTTKKKIYSLPITEGSVVIQSKKKIMEIIYTTLLKCYLKTNDSLVAPLVRLKDNCCHQEETERALKKAQKYPELLIFYNTRGLHRKALTLLQVCNIY